MGQDSRRFFDFVEFSNSFGQCDKSIVFYFDFICIGSSNRDFRTLTVDNGHLVEATSVKLVVVYSVCFGKSP